MESVLKAFLIIALFISMFLLTAGVYYVAINVGATGNNYIINELGKRRN